MKVLAIETSCDDTSLAVVSYDGSIFVCEKMVSFTQIDIHLLFGGVVPELASREHLDQILVVLQGLAKEYTASFSVDELMQAVDAVVVTKSPGLPGSLIIGRTLASFLSNRYDKPLFFVNHLHGHIFSFLLNRNFDILQSRNLILSVSGGHSDLSILSQGGNGDDVYIDRVGQYVIQKIGTTRDDAIGEVFDKVSRLLGGPYPGGVWVSKHAAAYSPGQYDMGDLPLITFKRIMLESDSFDFSFSGMKSQAYNFIEMYKKRLGLESSDVLPEGLIQYICYEFQEAATDILVKKIFLAISLYDIRLVALVGGVSANARLREKMISYKDQFEKKNGTVIQFYTPALFDYCTDNAAMIGVAGMVGQLM